MAENIKIFRGGGMNTDDAIELIPQNDYVEAFNSRVIGTSEGEEGLITNPESNTLIPNTLPNGLNKAIGAAGFEITRKAYSFIYNSQLYHLIAKLDYDANTQTNIFTNQTDSGGDNILPLNPEYYVNDIKLVNDYLLAWTDGNGQPYMINLTRLESGGYATLTEEDFLIIKGQPMIAPTVSYNSDETRSVNLLKGSLFQFTYQYVYLDSEYSAWSIISKREVPENENTPAIGTSVTTNNVLIVSVNIGTDRVKELNIGARIGLQDFFLARNIKREDILALPSAIDLPAEIREAYDPITNTYSFCFYNDGLYTNIDPIETDLDYDHVPLKCETLESVNGNILALGGITEGYERPETDILVQAVTYNPDIAIVPADPTLALRVENWQQVRVSGSSYRRVTIYYAGIAQEGDQFKIVTSNLDGVIYNTMTYTVTAGQDGDTEAAVRSFAATMPYPTSVYQFDTYWVLTFSTRRESETPDGGREQALIVDVILFGAGTGASESKATLKSNSSYQAFLWYKDKWGRYFPICTDSRYVVKTPSYSQIQGLASMLHWEIYHNPPAGAAYYGWGLSANTTHQTSLWVQGIIDPTASANGYFVFNINPLLKFNQANPSSILNYEYSAGDRCTFVYYNTGSNTATKTWLDKVDVEVVKFEITVSETDPTDINYLLTVKQPDSVTEAQLTGNNILLELYTPKKRTEVVNGVTEYTEQVMYEIGLSYPIVNGAHSVTSGDIKTGDVYIKSRQMVNGVDLNQLDDLVVEDFNFSDFYASAFWSNGKPRTYNDERGRIERKASIRWSETFQRDSLFNGLTRFYPENIYGDGDGETSSNYGWIRKIRQRNNILVVIQELKVGYVPVFQTIVEDQVADTQYALSLKLFNNVRYNGKNIGIGNAKESYAEWNNNIYFVDPFRSEPIRAGLDGIDVISGKMSKYFKRVLQEAYEAGKKIIGYYDIFYNEYLLSTETEGDILVAIPFNSLQWQLDDTYVIPPADISITTNGTKGVATYNSTTGIATYTPNNGETGSDNFTFSFTPSGGVLTTKRVCLTIEAGNDCPNVINFLDVTGAEFSQVYVSNPILITGIDIASPISISGAGEYRINGTGSWLTTPSTVVNGDSVEVRVTSSGTSNTTVSTTLTVGCQSDTYSVTSKDDTPDAFVFVDVTGAEINTLYTSNIVTITGITGSVAISVADGEYRIDGGAWTSVSGTITNGQTAQVRRTSSSSYNTSVGTTLTVGTYSDTYSILTRVANNVTVNFSVSFGLDPSTANWLAIERVRGGVNTQMALISSNASGTLPVGDFVEGDTINIFQGSYAPFMWAPTSKVNLSVLIDAVSYYNADNTTQGVTQSVPSYVIASGVSVIDITTLGSSTAVGYITENLRTNNYLALNDLGVTITDNLEAGLGITDVKPDNGTSDFSFNVKGTTGLLTTTINNYKATAIDYAVLGEGGYTKTGTIAGLGSVVHNDVTKGSITVEASDNNGAIACGTPTAYSGGQTYPTIQNITLGSGTGTVTLNYTSYSVPDKFIVMFDGVEVINTGYRGDASQQAALDAALATYGAPPETIAGTGSGSATFTKSTATTTATVYVYAPIAGTAWDFTLSCPV